MQPIENALQPYPDTATSQIYEMLFCDQPEHYRPDAQFAGQYPWNILLAETADPAALQSLIADTALGSRIRLLACNRLMAGGNMPASRDLLGVVVEVGLEGGLDTLAAYNDGTARYINQSGKILIWDAPTQQSNALIGDLLNESVKIVSQIGPWDQPRRPRPDTGMVRLSFLVSDGLYFGEGPINVLFRDPLAAPALSAATGLMQFLTQQPA